MKDIREKIIELDLQVHQILKLLNKLILKQICFSYLKKQQMKISEEAKTIKYLINN